MHTLMHTYIQQIIFTGIYKCFVPFLTLTYQFIYSLSETLLQICRKIWRMSTVIKLSKPDIIKYYIVYIDLNDICFTIIRRYRLVG